MSAAKTAANFRSTRSTGTLSSSPSEYSDGRDRRASLKRRSLPPGRMGPDCLLSGGAARLAGDHESRLRVELRQFYILCFLTIAERGKRRIRPFMGKSIKIN